MPGELPPSSAYTYAVELSVDQAVQAGATDVAFSKPVVTYVDNFLHFPAGTIVPAAYYDETKGAWVPSTNGVVLKIVAEPAGVAEVDVTGDDVADTGAALDHVGNHGRRAGPARQRAIPSARASGASPCQHFTPWDYNWPYGCRVGDCPPPDEPPPPPPYCPECQGAGLDRRHSSTRRSASRLAIVGTPFELAYESDRHPGYKEAYTVRVPAHRRDGPAEPAARRTSRSRSPGRTFTQSFAPAPNLQLHVHVGRQGRVRPRASQGAQVAHVEIGYAYPAVYLEPDEFERSFAQFGGEPVTRRSHATARSRSGRSGTGRSASSAPAPTRSAAGRSTSTTLRPAGEDPLPRRRHSAERRRPCGSQIDTVAGTGPVVLHRRHGDALATSIGYVRGVAAAPDGGFYIADTDNDVIRRVTPDGAIADGRRRRLAGRRDRRRAPGHAGALAVAERRRGRRRRHALHLRHRQRAYPQGRAERRSSRRSPAAATRACSATAAPRRPRR